MNHFFDKTILRKASLWYIYFIISHIISRFFNLIPLKILNPKFNQITHCIFFLICIENFIQIGLNNYFLYTFKIWIRYKNNQFCYKFLTKHDFFKIISNVNDIGYIICLGLKIITIYLPAFSHSNIFDNDTYNCS